MGCLGSRPGRAAASACANMTVGAARTSADAKNRENRCMILKGRSQCELWDTEGPPARWRGQVRTQETGYGTHDTASVSPCPAPCVLCPGNQRYPVPARTFVVRCFPHLPEHDHEPSPIHGPGSITALPAVPDPSLRRERLCRPDLRSRVVPDAVADRGF